MIASRTLADDRPAGALSPALLDRWRGNLLTRTVCASVQVLYETLAAACPIVIRLLSYRRDGTTFVSDVSVTVILGQGLEGATHLLWHFGEPQPHMSAGRQQAGRHAPGLPAMCGHAALHPGLGNGIPAAALTSCAQPVGDWRPPAHMVGSRAPGSYPASGSAAASARMPQISLPARLHEALQREAPYPQLVTERAPPHKIIHTNAAWRRLTGHGADELVGKPFEALLSLHDPGLHEMLRRAYLSAQQMTSLATLRKRSGDWLHSLLTASPLLDSGGTKVNWFVHVLHGPTAFCTADGSPVAPMEPYTATCCPSLDWQGMHDAFSGSGSAPASSFGGMPRGACGMAMPSRNGEHVELSALTEVQGAPPVKSAPGLAVQGSHHALQDPKQLQRATGMATLVGSNLGAPDAASQMSSSAGRAVTRDVSVMSALSTSSPSDQSDEAGANGSELTGSDAERAADALLAIEPMLEPGADPSAADASCIVAPQTAHVAFPPNSAAAATSTQPAGGAQNGGAQGAALDLRGTLNVQLLTHPASKELHETSSVSSTSSLGNADRFGAASSANGAGKEGSVGSERREPTSSAHGSEDALLRAAAKAAVGKCSASVANILSIAAARTSTAPVRVAPFLTKLFTILDDPQLDEYATWCRNGSALRIVSPQRFADHCLPRFFKHNKLGSFQQQLLTYGFSRVPNDSCLDRSSVWAHPHFRQHASAELEKIVRAAPTGGKRSASKAGMGLEEEESTAEEELEKMQKHVARLTQSVHGLHEELRSVRSVEMQALDQLVDRIQKRFKPNNGSESSDSSVATCPTERLDDGSCCSSNSGCGKMCLGKDSLSSGGLDAGSNRSRSDGGSSSNNNDDGSGGSPGSQ